MRRVSASDFARNFGKYQAEAISDGIIRVARSGTIEGAYLSSTELARFNALKRRERKILPVGELDDQTVSDIEAANYATEPN